MKQFAKLLGATLLGALIGFCGMMLLLALFGNKPIDELCTEMWTDFPEILGYGLTVLAAVAVSGVLHVVLHEGGHLLGGLLSGYRFVSFRIFGLTLLRQNGRWCIKRFGLAGTGGQCLLLPPDMPASQLPTALYNLGGVASNVFFGALSFLACVLWKGMPFVLICFFVSSAIVGLLMALTNGIPTKMGGIGNDGYNMLLLCKHPRSKEALIAQLKANAAVQEGLQPRELPESWFACATASDFEDALQATVVHMQAMRLLNSGKTAEAASVLEELLEHRERMMGLLEQETECELAYIYMTEGKTEQAEALLTKNLRLYIQQFAASSSAKQRLLMAIACQLEGNIEKARRIRDDVEQKRSQYLLQGEVAMDLELMDKLLLRHHEASHT